MLVFFCSLPVPWLLFSLINALQPVPVSSNGLFCAIVLLFLMLLFVIFSIASCKWRMNKILGFTMFLLYFVFLVISVMLEDRIISCPVSVWFSHGCSRWTESRRPGWKLLSVLPHQSNNKHDQECEVGSLDPQKWLSPWLRLLFPNTWASSGLRTLAWEGELLPLRQAAVMQSEGFPYETWG